MKRSHWNSWVVALAATVLFVAVVGQRGTAQEFTPPPLGTWNEASVIAATDWSVVLRTWRFKGICICGTEFGVITENAWSVPGPIGQGPPEQKNRRPVLSKFSNSGYWLTAYQAQEKALDQHMEKYNLQQQDWRPGLYKMMRDAQKK